MANKSNVNSIFEKLDNNKQSIHNNIADSISEEESDVEMALSYAEIIKAIPQDATKIPQEKYQQSHTEWRWRFFNFKNRKLVEISYKHPGKDRVYVNNKGQWINYIVSEKWDQFLTDTKYYYVKMI